MSVAPTPGERREQLADLLRRRRDARRTRPVSFAQRRLWFLDKLLSDGTLYNIGFALRLTGPLDRDRLEACLDAIVARHEVLRGRFEEHDGEPIQRIAEYQPLGLERVDCRAVARDGQRAEIRAQARELTGRPIDLSQGPLARGRLLSFGPKRGPEEHVLVMVVHHIAYDGWSSAIFMHELSALYAAGGRGGDAILPTLPWQYGDFAAWQQQQLDDAALAGHLDFWRDRLAGAAVLDLPTDHRRPPLPRHASERRSLDLDPALVDRLERLAHGSGATLFATVLAALKVLLHRYSGQTDIVVGSPIAGRSRRETESLIGCFVNTLVLRTDLSGDPSFRELLGRVRETVLGAFEHEALPFEKLVEALQPERDLSRNPFFQVLYSFQGAGDFAAPAREAPDGGLLLSQVELDSGTTRLDLEVYAFRGPLGLRLMVNFRRDLFEPDTIERLLGHLAVLLQAVAQDPDRRLSELPLLDAAERDRLRDWGCLPLPAPDGGCVHELVAAQAARTPTAPAVTMGERRLTYAELSADAGALAGRLVALGAGPGELVGVCLEREPRMVAALLGVLQSGAAYVPIDPAYPEERIAFMLDDARARVLVTTSDLAARLPRGGAAVLCLDEPGVPRTAVGAAAAPAPRGARAAGPDDLAYVIYTSGSTGRPKGVEVTHRSVLNLLASLRRAPGLSQQDVLLAVTTLSFDISVMEVFLPLIVGARLEVVSRAEAADGHALARRLAESGATVLQATPSTFRMLLDAGWPGDGRLKAVLGGEAWDWELATQLLARCGSIWNGYGPTEATVYATMRPVQAGEGRVHMGGAVGNVTLAVLDEHRQPVPIGVPGELYIGGAGVARGYLRRPELTAERFLPDPAAAPGARCYRTGDRVRWRSDGTLEYLGRLDHQVKLRGVRVEPGEIQEALSRHPDIAESLVVLREDRPGDQRLVAYLVARGGSLPPAPALRAFLRPWLPDALLPSAFVRLSAFPLNPVGKIDRAALPAPDADGAGRERDRVAPQGPVQELVASLLAGVLGLESVAVHDDFFELGGHSLLATRLVSRLRDAFELELPLAEVFAAPTVAGLSSRIEELRRGPSAPRLPALVACDDDGDAPLSFQQQRLWFLQQLDPQGAGYNMAITQRLRGPLDVAALQASLAALVERHAALRTSFPEVDGRPVARVAPALELELRRLDVSGLPAASRLAAAEQSLAEEAARPFELANGPLVRAALARLEDGDHLLQIGLHHIVGDGGSLDVLQAELGRLYAAAVAGETAALPALPLRYSDYARWQRSLLDGPALAAELDWWRATLAGAPPALDLPTDFPRPRVQRSAGGSEALAVDAATLAALRALGVREGASLFMVLLSAFEVLLMRASGVEDVVVGTPVSGRNRTEVEGLVGFFINTLVLRNDLSGRPSFRELLRRVRRTTLAAFGHQELPFEKLVEELAPERDLSRNPIFQVFVNQIEVPAGGPALPGLTVERAGGASLASSKFDLTLYLFVGEGGLAVRLNYNADLWEPATARALLGQYETLLAAVAADPERPITALPLLRPDERERLAARRNANVISHGYRHFAEAEAEQPVGERFAAQCRRDPERLAVETAERGWTYGEVDALARRLAGALLSELQARALAGPQRVALLVDPGGPQAAAVIGTLLSGHAYVPLDPAHPEAWLATLLQDTDAAIVVAAARHAPLARLLEGAEAGAASVIELDALADEPDRALPPLPRVAPDDLAYIRYTSGSTGRPKGVMQSHRGLLAQIRAYTNSLHIDAGDRLSALSSYTHDGGLMDLYGALLNGATLCPVPLREHEPRQALAALQQLGVTILHATPSAFRHLLSGLADDSQLAAVRLVVFGGEEPRPEDLALYQLHFGPGCWLVNGLGATECSQGLQCFLGRDAPPRRLRVPVGLPIEGVQAVLLDRYGDETEACGELAFDSDHVALGYWRQPERTAEVFSPGEAGRGRVRRYRTGDLARRLPDGRFEWLGRKDGQIKVRGHRVEPGGVAAALRALPGIEQAAVVARSGPDGEMRLVGYVVPRQRTVAGAAGSVAATSADALDAVALRAALREALPEPMLPGAIVLLDALPVTAGGKLDARALPEPDWSGASRAGEALAPATATESALAGIYAEVLGLAAVGAGDHFFELGGHSLLATQVVSRVRGALQAELPLRELFEHPTVRGLARRLDELSAQCAPGDDGRLRRAPEGSAPALSFGQERFWFLEQLQPGSAAPNMHASRRLTGALDVGALRAAFAAVLERHEALRASFPVDEQGNAACRIAPALPDALAVIDLGPLEPPAQEAEVARLSSQSAQTAFDIGRGPLLRASLVRLSATEHVLLLTVHHMVFDAWSMGLFWRDLFAAYTAAATGSESGLPPLPIRYRDYAWWQRSQLEHGPLAGELAHWSARLAGAPPRLELPTDRPRPAVESFEGARRSRALDEPLTAALGALAARQEATLFMVLLAGFQALLARYSGQTDIVVGVPVAGRTHTEVEDLIGLFVNSLVLRTDLSGEPAFDELVGRVRAVSLEAFAHQDLPFERLVAALNPPRDLSHHPVFQVIFALQNAPRPELPVTGLDVQPARAERATSQFDLTLHAWELGGRIILTAEYKRGLFDEATIDRLLEHYERLLARCAAEPACCPARVSLAGPDERARLLEAGRAAAASPGSDATLHGLFEAQAARTPQAVAVEFEDRTLSYAELDRRASALASRLAAAGVGRGARVGLCVERGPELPEGLLGILKSGAAYVPLDPSHPRERLSFELADAEVSALVTQPAVDAALPGLCAAPLLLLGEAAGGDGPDGATHAADRAAARAGAERTGPDDAAYLIYTSGSTGRPKGVLVPHGAVVNFLRSMRERPGLSPDDVVLSVTTIAFDIAVLELFGPLSVGARVVIVPAAAAADGMALESRLARSGVTLAQATPATWRLLLEVGWPGDRRLRLLCGGEAWSRALADELLPRCGSLWNMYGPTETTVWSAVQRVEPGAAPVAIGEPIASTQLYVLEPHGDLAPIGVPGELCIGGAGVAIGYWKRPELTDERFRPDPFAADPAARLYRTGDRVRRRADGLIEFLGRTDDQVKVQGLRIELGEIEAQLAELPGVKEAAAGVHRVGAGDSRLVAWVVPGPGATLQAPELQQALRARLPAYMVPSSYELLAQLPRTPNGKLDRRALPVPRPARGGAAGRADMRPSTAFERRLAAIWQDLLGVEDVSVLDNFFDLGGHSLLTMRVVVRLEQQTGVRLNPGELIAQTLAQVAQACERCHATRTATDGAAPESGTPAQDGAPRAGTPVAGAGWARRLLGRTPRRTPDGGS
jgi:amino acid adenylation domain-containing protein